MGYLGLSGPIVKEDNIFQRLFWPSDHAGEADSLGQQGFWVCATVAIFSAIMLTIGGHWAIALLTFIFFALGGIGVREHSTFAAASVALVYLLNQALVLLAGVPSFLGLAVSVLLIANIRGTWIAAKWAKSGDPDAVPERMRETWRDRLVDQMPARVWPKGRSIFYCVAAIYVLMNVLGTVAILKRASRTSGSCSRPDPGGGPTPLVRAICIHLD